MRIVEDYLSLPEWLQDNDRELYAALYGGEDAVTLDELQAVGDFLKIQDVDEHAARIRRGLRDDPAQAIGSSKELLETVFKAILDLRGNGSETKLDIPQLLHAASSKLGFNAGGHRDGGPGADQRRKLFGALANIVSLTAELRNSGFGTGHGGAHRPQLDVPTARLVVSAAVAVATFYLEAYSVEFEGDPAHDS
ncbi:abortive infection family protein [Micromonospora sp. WMMD987]|uniref:abortive infection family protein n=1 Tax=Micromonospora sp. WMMD987 TaxID=3016089 RepID=UPI00249C313F|nr:abortive infection family protein [Micromonospora sp. WMMD987]WFE96568.1 abortive infection family protein [Micromonospora sp. WMMD987]